MIIGFTGTRSGMTQLQKDAIKKFLEDIKVEEYHHGGCHGADSDFHDLVEWRSKVVIHPGDVYQSTNFEGDNLTILSIKPYLERNKDIVNACDMLLACPKSSKEELRSGTWATIRYAKKINKDFIIFLP